MNKLRKFILQIYILMARPNFYILRPKLKFRTCKVQYGPKSPFKVQEASRNLSKSQYLTINTLIDFHLQGNIFLMSNFASLILSASFGRLLT